MQTFVSVVLWYFLCVCCVMLRLTDAGPINNNIPNSLLQLNDIPEEKGRLDLDRQQYLTSYVRNLYKELSIYDTYKSLIARDDTSLAEVEKQLANVHILHQTSGSRNLLKFDVSSLPRNLHISHAELVIPGVKSNPTNEEDDYNVSDVTKSFKSLFISNADEFAVSSNKEIPSDLNTAQLVIFENVNDTLLTSLRSRQKRRIHTDWQQEKDEKSSCSVSPWEVNFTDIGWGDWLWFPTSYFANVCSGNCALDRDNFTSHALIKRYSHLQEKKTNKRQTRINIVCSPYEYKPLTILYMNKHNHVIMKQLSNMKVVSCICR